MTLTWLRSLQHASGVAIVDNQNLIDARLPLLERNVRVVSLSNEMAEGERGGECAERVRRRRGRDGEEGGGREARGEEGTVMWRGGGEEKLRIGGRNRREVVFKSNNRFLLWSEEIPSFADLQNHLGKLSVATFLCRIRSLLDSPTRLCGGIRQSWKISLLKH